VRTKIGTGRDDAPADGHRALAAPPPASPKVLAQLAKLEGLQRAVEMTASGGTFNTYLGDLRRNSLIVERDRRCVANDILFPEATP
jgi:hypothetical protein